MVAFAPEAVDGALVGGGIHAADVHKATLTILAFSTAHVITVDEFRALAGATARQANEAVAA